MYFHVKYLGVSSDFSMRPSRLTRKHISLYVHGMLWFSFQTLEVDWGLKIIKLVAQNESLLLAVSHMSKRTSPHLHTFLHRQKHENFTHQNKSASLSHPNILPLGHVSPQRAFSHFCFLVHFYWILYVVTVEDVIKRRFFYIQRLHIKNKMFVPPNHFMYIQFELAAIRQLFYYFSFAICASHFVFFPFTSSSIFIRLFHIHRKWMTSGSQCETSCNFVGINQ